MQMFRRGVGAMLAALLVSSTAASTQEAATGLQASLVMADEDGRQIDRATAGALTTLTVRFDDATTGRPRAGLYPNAWLRRDPTRGPCVEVAKQLRVTGRLTSDDIALTGTTFASLGTDNRLALIHPDVSLATSNIAALIPFAETPSDILSHRSGPIFIALEQAGQILSIDPQSGASKVFAQGLIAPRQLLDAAEGRVWVIDQIGAHLFNRNGEIVGQTIADRASAAPAGRDKLVLRSHGKDAQIIDRGTGTVRTRLSTISPDQSLAAHDSFVVRSDSTHASLIYFDDPSHARRLPTSGPVSDVAVSDDGAFALLWSNTTRRIDVVDLVTTMRMHSFEASDAIDQVRFAGDAAFITYVSRAVVSVVNLRVLGDADNAVRDVRLAEPATDAPSARAGNLITSLAPASAVLVARPGGNALYTVMAGGGLANAPMSVLSLKSASPRTLLAHRRMLEATADGRYAGSVRIPGGGTWELIVTTGVQGTTACFPFIVEGPAGPHNVQARKLAVRHVQPLHAQQATQLVLSIVQHSGTLEPLRVTVLPIRVTALSGRWMRSFLATPSTDDAYNMSVTFPWSGTYVLSAGHGHILPTTIEIAP